MALIPKEKGFSAMIVKSKVTQQPQRIAVWKNQERRGLFIVSIAPHR
jgi:hypothetical protein